jgi:hypothetical protein
MADTKSKNEALETIIRKLQEENQEYKMNFEVLTSFLKQKYAEDKETVEQITRGK